MAFLRTAFLLGFLTAILLGIGYLFGGMGGMTMALFIAFAINFLSYWFSDKIVLAMYRAKPYKDAKINAMVAKLAKAANIPRPDVYIVDMGSPNAFATGRSPSHSAIAVTHSLLERLEDDEIEGVLAHEMSHIKNRDTLVSTMAATIAGAISYLAQMAWYGLGSRDDNRGSSILFLPLLLLAPFAAMLIQLAISRGREFGADKTGVALSKKPLALASALEKISSAASHSRQKGNAATSHMWIVNPFSSGGFVSLFMTHPPMEERVRRLRQMA